MNVSKNIVIKVNGQIVGKVESFEVRDLNPFKMAKEMREKKANSKRGYYAKDKDSAHIFICINGELIGAIQSLESRIENGKCCVEMSRVQFDHKTIEDLIPFKGQGEPVQIEVLTGENFQNAKTIQWLENVSLNKLQSSQDGYIITDRMTAEADASWIAKENK